MSMHGHRKPYPRFDYQYLASLDDSASVGELFFLTEPAQQVLSQLADIVLWTDTRWYNGAAADIETMAHKIQEQLRVPLHLDDLIPYVDDIETLLRAMQQLGTGCCPTNLTYFPVPPIGDSGFDPIDGPAPATWGNGETVADLSDYEQLICGAANAYVDYLAGVGDNLDQLVVQGTLAVAAIAAILGTLAGAGLLVILEYGAISSIVGGIIAGATTALFGDAAAAIEANRSAIVCSMMAFNGLELAHAIQNTVSALSWSLFYSHIDYQTALDVMQTGEYEGSTLPIVRMTSCACSDSRNPAAGFYFAVDYPLTSRFKIDYTQFSATVTVTDTVLGTILRGMAMNGTTDTQIASNGGLERFYITNDPCTYIVGYAFTVTAFNVSEFTPQLQINNVASYKTTGDPTLVVGDKVAVGIFEYLDATAKAWLDANYDHWFSVSNWDGGLYLKIDSPSPPYPRSFNFNFTNLYMLAKTGFSDCQERYT